MTKLVIYAKNFFRKGEEGATMVEYALMVFLIAIACIVAVTALGTSVKNVFNSITAGL